MPKLVPGFTFVPEGCSSLKIVIFIQVTGCFAYSFECADIVYHGQVEAREKAVIEERCRQNCITFMTITPKDELFQLAGVNVCNYTSETYNKCFSGLQLDPKSVHNCLCEISQKYDEERGTIQSTLGVSTQNYQCSTKSTEELEMMLLDAPLWSGSQSVFELLSPHVCDVVDKLQDFIDAIYPTQNRQQSNSHRLQLFASRLNKKMGCNRNRSEAATISILYLNPRTNSLKRHVDKFNDTRDGYSVTAIWSCVFDEFNKDGKEIRARLSVIVYNCVHAGNYADRISSYVTVFQKRIQDVLSIDRYSRANKFCNLNLAEACAAGDFSEETVWASGSNHVTITCLVTPMYFDPCSFLGAFAWCISRLRPKFWLSRLEVVELVYLASIQNSVLPFVWLTQQLLRDDAILCRKSLEERGVSRFFHDEICRRTQRKNGYGGSHQRHQCCQSHTPGMVSIYDNTFTKESNDEKNNRMKQLDEIINLVSDPKSTMSGKEALDQMQSKIAMLGNLNILKVLPLLALVGLFDIKVCFGKVLYGQVPETKPHGLELEKLGCNTSHLQEKYLQGLNEYFGKPREYFFHGDHVLCMAQGIYTFPERNKVDVFFQDMPLMTFTNHEMAGTVCIIKKEYGCKEWKHYQPHLWSREQAT